MLRFITVRDHRLMRRVHRWSPPRWVRLWMTASTRAGDGWLWYAAGLAILWFGGEHGFAAVVAGGLAGAASIVLFPVLKRLTGRERPCAIEPHAWSRLLPPDQFSFPSGHTMSAFAVSVVWSQFYPDLALALLFCAASIAASRVLLGMHFLSDVVAGALLGWGLGYASWIIFG